MLRNLMDSDQIEEELKSVFIMSCLRHRLQQDLMRQAELAAKQDDEQGDVMVFTGCVFPEYQSTAAADILEFDKLLILKPREEANRLGEAMLRRSANKEIDFAKSYAASNLARDTFLHAQVKLLSDEETEDEALTKLLETTLTFAEVGAFDSAEFIIEKLPYGSLKKMKLYCGKLFQKALHFGSSEFVNDLLGKGMNPNWVDTGSEEGAYRPLQLVVNDLSRYIINMSRMIAECEQDAEKQKRYGTPEQLYNVSLSRYFAHCNIFSALLRGYHADPDLAPDRNMNYDVTPRILARSLLVELQELLKDDELNEWVKKIFEMVSKVLKTLVEHTNGRQHGMQHAVLYRSQPKDKCADNSNKHLPHMK